MMMMVKMMVMMKMVVSHDALACNACSVAYLLSSGIMSVQENQDLLLLQSGLQEHVQALQERVQKLQDENDYFSVFKEDDILVREEDVNAAFPEVPDSTTTDGLRRQLQDREHELLCLHETLDEERARSAALHTQVVHQAEELGEARAALGKAAQTRNELEALRKVHAETLEKLVTVQLEVDMLRRDARGGGTGRDGAETRGRGRDVFDADDGCGVDRVEAGPGSGDSASWLVMT